MRMVLVKIDIEGVYLWGPGWTKDNMNKWKNYFKNNNFIYWRYFEQSNDNSEYLVSVHAGGMIHPMGFTMKFVDEYSDDEKYTDSAIAELKNIFKNLETVFTNCKVETNMQIANI